MTVEELARIFNKMVLDGKGDYDVSNTDWEEVKRIEIDDACKSVQII